MAQLLIKSVKPKPFKSTVGGEEIPYFWYRAEREDGTTIEFGSKNGQYEIGKLETVPLEKREGLDGRVRYFG